MMMMMMMSVVMEVMMNDYDDPYQIAVVFFRRRDCRRLRLSNVSLICSAERMQDLLLVQAL
jgi:hypothetical protein